MGDSPGASGQEPQAGHEEVEIGNLKLERNRLKSDLESKKPGVLAGGVRLCFSGAGGIGGVWTDLGVWVRQLR